MPLVLFLFVEVAVVGALALVAIWVALAALVVGIPLGIARAHVHLIDKRLREWDKAAWKATGRYHSAPRTVDEYEAQYRLEVLAQATEVDYESQAVLLRVRYEAARTGVQEWQAYQALEDRREEDIRLRFTTWRKFFK